MTRACTCTDSPQIASVCVCHARAEAVQALHSIRLALTGVYTPAGIATWLHAANKRLEGASPMQLVMAGRGLEALTEARTVAGRTNR